MKIFFIALPLLYLLLNGYLYWRVSLMMHSLPLSLKILVGLLFWTLTIALFVVIILRGAALPQSLSRTLFNLGSTWLLLSFYLVIALTLFDTLRLFIELPAHPFWFALLLTIVTMIYGYINYRNPKVERIEIECDGKFEPLKLVAVSDIHLGYGTTKSDMKRYAELINREGADVVVIAGDLIDNSLRPLTDNRMEEELSMLKAEKGIYMVAGNHEYISGIESCCDFLKKTPIVLLRDSIVNLDGGVQIIGRDDRVNRRRKSLEELYSHCDTTRPTILLDHQPYNLLKTDSLGITLQISGHTHHGQVWPLNTLTNYIYEQSHGYRAWQRSHIWVSSGLSLWGPKFRIGTRGDIAVITIKPRNRE